MTRALAGVLALAAAAAVTACGERAPVGPVVRDSAGVLVSESPASALTRVPQWRVADPPLLEIGAVEGAAEQQFGGIEAVLRLADGRLAVADRGSSQIRWFDDHGRYLESRGRPGEAPGEYRHLAALGSGPGDSLWAYDFGLRRFTVLTPSGDAVRTVSVEAALAAPTAVGRLRDGSFVIQEQWSSALHGGARGGLVRDSAAVARLTTDGATLDTITLVPGREVFIGSEDGRAVMSAPLLAHHAVVTMNDSLVYVGDQSRFEVRVFRPSGILVRVVRITGLDFAAGADAIAHATEARLSEAPERDRPMLRAHLAAMTTPATRPAYGSLLLDDAGDLWVGSYEDAGPSRSWTVFGPDGVLRATVSVPAAFTVRQITGDFVIGTWEDAMDVEYVRVYGLRRLRG